LCPPSFSFFLFWVLFRLTPLGEYILFQMEDEAVKRRERLKALRSLKSENPESEISLKRLREDDPAQSEAATKEPRVEEEEEEDKP